MLVAKSAIANAKFVGFFDRNDTPRVQIHTGRQVVDLPLFEGVRCHAKGFAWGYAGSGPAQLALAMCCAIAPADVAQLHHQRVKELLIVPLDGDAGFELSAQKVADALRRLDKGGSADGADGGESAQPAVGSAS